MIPHRSGRPDVWIYRHRRARRELYRDDVGATYRLVPTPRGASAGQFRRCKLKTALFGSAIHSVVDPHWWRHPEDRRPDRDELDRPDWTVPPPRYRWIDDDVTDDERWPGSATATRATATPRRVSPSLRLIEGEGLGTQAPARRRRPAALPDASDPGHPA